MEHDIKHLAIIMDGNARWAKKNGLIKAQGHRKGADTAKNILPAIADLNIPYLTLYAFSSENWQRPVNEVNVLINLLGHYVESEAKNLNKNGIRLKVIGRLEKLPQKLQDKIMKIAEVTKDNKKITVCIAFGYGSRCEIADACRKILDSGAKTISEQEFSKYLYDPEMPDVDLLIRTGGLYRISNFLLWQSAYAELYFLDKFWPEFNKEDLVAAINDYSKRKRNFGGR